MATVSGGPFQFAKNVFARTRELHPMGPRRGRRGGAEWQDALCVVRIGPFPNPADWVRILVPEGTITSALTVYSYNYERLTLSFIFGRYACDAPEKVERVEVSGDATQITREDGVTFVLVTNENGAPTRITLNESLVAFNLLLEKGDFHAAADALEPSRKRNGGLVTQETENMWRQLMASCLRNKSVKSVYVARRCAAALGNGTCGNYLGFPKSRPPCFCRPSLTSTAVMKRKYPTYITNALFYLSPGDCSDRLR